MKKPKTKLSIPQRVFTITFHQEGVIHRINSLGFNIANMETKLELSKLTELAFQEFNDLKKHHT